MHRHDRLASPVFACFLACLAAATLGCGPTATHHASDLPRSKEWHPAHDDVSLDDYRAERLELLAAAASHELTDVLATVTFVRPLDVDAALAALDAVDVSELTVHGQDATGSLSTGTHRVDRPELRARLRPTLEAEPDILGAVAAVVTGPAEALQALQGRNDVYLVDVGVDEAFLPDVPDRRPLPSLAWNLWCAEAGRETREECRQPG